MSSFRWHNLLQLSRDDGKAVRLMVFVVAPSLLELQAAAAEVIIMIATFGCGPICSMSKPPGCGSHCQLVNIQFCTQMMHKPLGCGRVTMMAHEGRRQLSYRRGRAAPSTKLLACDRWSQIARPFFKTRDCNLVELDDPGKALKHVHPHMDHDDVSLGTCRVQQELRQAPQIAYAYDVV